MSIEFISTEYWSEFLDPRAEFQPGRARCEIRVHPLTGHTSRIAHIGMPPREAYTVPEEVREAAIPIFAPPLVTEITPQFRPEDLPRDRYTRGRCVLFPNLNPYDRFSPVIAIGDQPFVEPGDLSTEDLTDAFVLAKEFFTDLGEEAEIGVVGWNFWPAGGSSIPHPHLQAVAAGRLPDRQQKERDGERAFATRTGEPFWPAFVAAERTGPRWLGEDDGWAAVVEFAPRTVVPETVLIASAADQLQEAGDSLLGSLAKWIIRLIGAHTGEGIPAFNVVLHPTAPLGDPATSLRARFLPRVYIMESVYSADMVWVQVGLEEGLTSIVPEEWAEVLRGSL